MLQLREAARRDAQGGFAVESIIGHKVRDGRLFLRVKWLGFANELASEKIRAGLTDLGRNLRRSSSFGR